jgi:hypothetical protein
VTSRRSATGDGVRAAGGGASGTAPAIAVPHFEQNFAAGATAAPQAGQVRARAVPHSLQKFASGALAVWQAGQIRSPSTPQLSRIPTL